MTHPTQALHIPDTQSERDERHLAIQRVGIKDVRYPLRLRVAGAVQTTRGAVGPRRGLARREEGHAHVALRGLAERRRRRWMRRSTPPCCASGWRRCSRAWVPRRAASRRAFRFFLRKRAPVSGVQSLLDYQGRWIAETRGGSTTVWAEVAVPVKSLCPCSKEISDYGAHNQRSTVTIRAEMKAPVDWQELVRFAEDNASSEVWALLKRPDEKWITERAYENPKFVEDLVRDVALALNADARIGRYCVEVENHESIHNHAAYARIERA